MSVPVEIASLIFLDRIYRINEIYFVARNGSGLRLIKVGAWRQSLPGLKDCEGSHLKYLLFDTKNQRSPAEMGV
jgi:hypothetical protein